ncbi:hypothetical protein [Methanopyrus sp.]
MPDPDPYEVPIIPSDDAKKKISETVKVYTEERLEGIVPEDASQIRGEVISQTSGRIRGLIDDLDEWSPGKWLAKQFLELCDTLLELNSGYFHEMFEELIWSSLRRSSCKVPVDFLGEYYLWLIDVTEMACSEGRNLIVKDLIKGPLKLEPVLDALIDVEIIKTLTDLDHKELAKLDSEDNLPDLRFLRLQMTFKPPHVLNDDEIKNKIMALKIARVYTWLVSSISKPAKSIVGLYLLSPVLVNRGIDDKEWVKDVLKNHLKFILQYSTSYDLLVHIVQEGKNEEEIARETVKDYSDEFEIRNKEDSGRVTVFSIRTRNRRRRVVPSGGREEDYEDSGEERSARADRTHRRAR